MTAILQVLLRGTVVLLLYGALLATLHRLIGADEAEHRLRRRVRRVQTASFLVAMAALLVELMVYLRDVLAAGGRSSWSGAVFGWGWPAMFTWLALAAPAVLAGWFVWSRQRPACRALAEEAERVLDDPASATDGNALQEWDRRLAVASRQMPLLAARWLDPLRRRLRDAQLVKPDVHLERAREALRRGGRDEALKHLLRCQPDSLDALLLAADCQSWNTAYQRVVAAGPHMPRLEAAQLMAAYAGEGQAHLAFEWLGGREGSRRRAAAIEYHRGRKAEARRLLSGDWEARVWVKDDLSNTAVQT